MSRPLLRIMLTLFAAGALSVAFNAYLQPDFIIDIANRLLLCM